ncbi:hypothetical protein DFH28DRAFT_429990 [Melampsora americana]|nr:hypothetical protein DFH28DRAFT_429990 [Melampsora americana]
MEFSSTLQNMDLNQESSLGRIDPAPKPPIPSTFTSNKSFSIRSNTQENRPIRPRMISVNPDEPAQNHPQTMIKPNDTINPKSSYKKSDDQLQENIILQVSNTNIFNASIDSMVSEKEDSLSQEIDCARSHHQSAKELIKHHGLLGFDTENIRSNQSGELICSVSNCKASFDQKWYIQRHKKLHSDFNRTPEFNCQCGRGFDEREELIKHCILGICYGSIIPFR